MWMKNRCHNAAQVRKGSRLQTQIYIMSKYSCTAEAVSRWHILGISGSVRCMKKTMNEAQASWRENRNSQEDLQTGTQFIAAWWCPRKSEQLPAEWEFRLAIYVIYVPNYPALLYNHCTESSNLCYLTEALPHNLREVSGTIHSNVHEIFTIAELAERKVLQGFVSGSYLGTWYLRHPVMSSKVNFDIR